MSHVYDRLLNDWRVSIRRLFSDWKRLWKASRATSVSVLVTQVILGLAPVLFLWIFSELVSALIGARGVGIFTSDVSKWFWWMILLWLCIVVSISFTKALKGFTLDVGSRTRVALFVLSLFFLALPAGPIRVGLIVIAIVVPAFVKLRYASLVTSAIVLLLTLQVLYDLVALVVHKGVLIGDGIAWGGALLVFASWLILQTKVKS
ncbi:MAG: hypothetical protein Q8P30_02245 [Candidatus Uhrbacteria bacterium]|nr:hypothetical protein [Candidatus Uhrbacteria bacterium]